MPRPIVIESVTLVGFGPYRDETRFEFPRGLGVLAAPNEAGKSTLAAAISAILFGLPGTADPSAFGLGKFRNWHDPTRCLGEMTLDAGGVRYRLVRDFDTHRIKLLRWDGRGWLEEVVGEHNPAARRGNPRYLGWLASLFHHTSRELFHHTFCVVQPLPQPDRLSAELQSLLAGTSDRATHQDALKRLAERAKELTRRTGAMGLTPRDGQKPGRLEQIDDKIAELQQAIMQSREAIAELLAAREESARLKAEIEERKLKVAQLKKALAAFDAWRRHAENVREASEALRRLRRGSEQCERLERELAEAREKLGLFPELASVPPEFGEGLERLEDLSLLLAEGEQLCARAAEIRRELERLKEERQLVAMPAEDGQAASSWLRQALRDLDEALASWERFVKGRERLERLASERRRYAVFDEAAPATLAVIASYDERRAALQEELERAEAELARAQAAAQEAAEAKKKIEERFAAARRYAGHRESLKRMQELFAALGAKESQLAQIQARLDRVDKAGAVLMLLGSIAVFCGLFQPEPGPLEAVGGLLMLLSPVVKYGLPPVRRLRQEAEALEDEINALREEKKRLAAALPEAPPGTPQELQALLDEIDRYLEAAGMAQALRAVAPGGEELRRLEESVVRARRALAALDAALVAPRRAFDDFREAYRSWLSLKEEEARTREELERMLDGWGLAGTDPREVENVPVLDPGRLKGIWSRAFAAAEALARLGLAAGFSRFGELVEAAADLVGRREVLAQRAEAFVDLSRRIARLEGEWERLKAPGGALDELIRRALSACDGLEQAFAGDWSRLRRLVEGLAFDKPPRAEALAEALPSPFREAVAKAGGRIDEARQRWQEYRYWLERAQRARESLAATLEALECEDRDELERRMTVADARLRAELAAMEQLAQEHPGLPPPRADGLYEEVEARYRALEGSIQELEAANEAARGRLEELGYRQARLEGEAPVNIAEAEVLLRRLQAERQRIEEELDALALAYRELEAAAAEYYDSHLDRLAARAGEYFAAVTRTQGRRLLVDGELKISAVEPDGKIVLPGQLSQGTKDQLYLALRLAVGDLLSASAKPPFIFDDPFLNCDGERRAEIRAALEQIAKERQVILLTHDQELATWGDPIVVRRGLGEGRE